MSDLAKYLKLVSNDLKMLENDIDRILIKQAQSKTDHTSTKSRKDEFKEIPLKSFQSRTRIYKDKKELVEAQDNPEVDFVIDRINNIFRR